VAATSRAQVAAAAAFVVSVIDTAAEMQLGLVLPVWYSAGACAYVPAGSLYVGYVVQGCHRAAKRCFWHCSLLLVISRFSPSGATEWLPVWMQREKIGLFVDCV
jgi:hypothetical protein